MGAHFSPCGRFLAAFVACVLPPFKSDLHVQGSRSMNGSPGARNSVHLPSQHPISAQQVIYKLRVYSLEEAKFGQVLASRVVRAAHCLTSIQVRGFWNRAIEIEEHWSFVLAKGFPTYAG